MSNLTLTPTTHDAPQLLRRGLAGWLGRRQAALSDRMHSAGDLRAAGRGWEITSGTGRLGFGTRTYHDPRFTARRAAMAGRDYPVPTERRPFSELARPAREPLTEPVGTATDTVGERMRSLAVAAAGAITDYSDVVVRGGLKERPDAVAFRLDLLCQMVAVVRRQVRAEEIAWRRQDVAHGWPRLDPAAEHAGQVAEYAAHTGCCDWYLVGATRGRQRDPEPFPDSGVGGLQTRPELFLFVPTTVLQ